MPVLHRVMLCSVSTIPDIQKTRVIGEPRLLSQQKVHHLQVNTNIPLMLIIPNFLQHVLHHFILFLQRSRVSEGYRGKPVVVVQQNTFQRSLAAVNEVSNLLVSTVALRVCTEAVQYPYSTPSPLHDCCGRR